MAKILIEASSSKSIFDVYNNSKMAKNKVQNQISSTTQSAPWNNVSKLPQWKKNDIILARVNCC